MTYRFDNTNKQSPTESLNSDSRPGSVLDEQENTNEPPETPLVETERKDDEKSMDLTSDANSSVAIKDEKSESTLLNNVEKAELTIDKDKEIMANEKLKSSSSEDSSNSIDDRCETVSKSINSTKSIDTVGTQSSSTVSTTIISTSSSTTTTASTTIATGIFTNRSKYKKTKDDCYGQINVHFDEISFFFLLSLQHQWHQQLSLQQ